MTLQQQLHHIHASLGISWNEIAWLLGINHATIYRMRIGNPSNRQPVHMMTRWLCRALDNGARVPILVGIMGIKRTEKQNRRTHDREEILRDHAWCYILRHAWKAEEANTVQMFGKGTRNGRR